MNTTVKVSPRQRLSAERLRRRWSQLEVADQLGTTPGNVSRWERGLTSPGPYFRSKLCELFGRSAKELGLTWDESDVSLNHNTPASSSMFAFFLWDTLPRSNLLFAGRKDLFAQLHTLLRPDTTKACPAILAISSSNGLNNPEKGMRITPQEWQAFLGYFQQTLATFNVPQPEQEELFAIVESTREAIVTSPVQEN